MKFLGLQLQKNHLILYCILVIVILYIMKNKEKIISDFVNIIDKLSVQTKKKAFILFKKKLVQSKIKDLAKQTKQYTTKKSNSNRSVDQSNYMTITDFKPIQNSYTSVKILNYQAHDLTIDTQQNMNKKYFIDSSTEETEKFLQHWMTREQLQQILPEDYPYSDYCSKKVSQYTTQALDTIKNIKYTTYLKNHVKQNQSWIFSSGDRMKYKDRSISSSILHLPQNLQEQAIEMFQQLLYAANYKQTDKDPLYHIYEFIRLTNEQQGLIQQAYVQVLKQISSQKLIYWQIFACLTICIKPNTRIYLPLLNFLYNQFLLNPLNKFPQLISYSFYHLIKNFSSPRKNLPCLFQLYCSKKLKKIPIIISFPRQKIFFIQSYSLIQDLIEQMINFYGLDRNVQYILYTNGKILQKGYFLDNFVLDHDKEVVWKDYVNFTGFNTIIVLKNMMLMKSSQRTFNIMYNYFVHQYLRGFFSFNTFELVKIAGLILHSENPNPQYTIFSLNNILPKRKIKNMTKAKIDRIIHLILKSYFVFNGSRLEARKTIMKIFEKSKGFMTHFFISRIYYDDEQTIDCVIGLKWNKILIIDKSYGRVMKQIPYEVIRQWGCSKSQICLVFDKAYRLHIQARNINQLVSMFQCYLDYCVQKSAIGFI